MGNIISKIQMPDGTKYSLHDAEAILFSEQELTEIQKTQAKDNLDIILDASLTQPGTFAEAAAVGAAIAAIGQPKIYWDE